MSKFGEVAVKAAQLVSSDSALSPNQAWEKAAQEAFPANSAFRTKGCPKGAFLGLCSEGLITGIPAGNYSRSSKNKDYAVRAVSILQSNKFLASQPDLLWKKVAGATISHNHQMDVVVSLWAVERVRS